MRPTAASIEASEAAITFFLVRLATDSGAAPIPRDRTQHGQPRPASRPPADAAWAGALDRRDHFGQVFLAAPDLDVDLFRDLAPFYPKVSERTTAYVSARGSCAGSLALASRLRPRRICPSRDHRRGHRHDRSNRAGPVDPRTRLFRRSPRRPPRHATCCGRTPPPARGYAYTQSEIPMDDLTGRSPENRFPPRVGLSRIVLESDAMADEENSTDIPKRVVTTLGN